MKSRRIIIKKKIKPSFKKTNKRIVLKHRRKIKYLAICFLIILIYLVSYFKVIISNGLSFNTTLLPLKSHFPISRSTKLQIRASFKSL